MRYELKIALRYLRARRKEAFISITTIFTAVGVMIGVAALTITLSVIGGFEASLKQRVLSLSPQVQIMNGDGSISNYAEIEAIADRVKGVDGSDPFIIGQGMMSSGRGIGGVVVRGIEPDNPAVQGRWSHYMKEGGLKDLAKDVPVTGTSGGPVVSGGRIAVGVGLADKLKIKLGDEVRIIAPIFSGPDGSLTTKTADFKVGAVFDSGMAFFDTNVTFMDLGHAQNFFGRLGRADGVDVHLANLDDTAAVTTALRHQLKQPYIVRNWIESNESASAGFEILKRVYALVLMLLIGVAAFNLVATL
ncbi:MAG TPA: ABC transporter permease, partial [Candidatus Binataceae bacterium]